MSWLDADDEVRGSLPVAAHLGTCQLCRQLLEGASDPIALPSQATVEQSEVFEAPPPRDTPAPGEVWRLAWDDSSELALVWRSLDDWFSVVPVRADPSYADDRTMSRESPSEVLPGPLTFWFGLESSVPLAVFDRFWFELDTEPLAGFRSRVRERKPIESVEYTIGAEITDPLDDRYEYREQLADRFETFACASWRSEPAERRTMSDLVGASGVEWRAVTDVLGMEPHERLRLRRAQHAISPAEAARLAPVLGTTPTVVLATNPPVPAELADALDHPRWKGRVRSLRRAEGLDEATARYKMAVAALSLAARESTPPTTEEQWEARLEHVFAT